MNYTFLCFCLYIYILQPTIRHHIPAPSTITTHNERTTKTTELYTEIPKIHKIYSAATTLNQLSNTQTHILVY